MSENDFGVGATATNKITRPAGLTFNPSNHELSGCHSLGTSHCKLPTKEKK